MTPRQKTFLVTLTACAAMVAAVLFLTAQFSPPGPPRQAAVSADAVPQKPVDADKSAVRAQPKVARAGEPTLPADNEAQQRRPGGTQAGNAKRQSTAPEVGVIMVSAQPHQASVTGYGEVQPLFNLSLTAQVSGQIQALSDNFLTGRFVQKGEVIAQLDDTDYVQAVAIAKAGVEEAIVALEEERLQGDQAADEWRRSGLTGEPASALVLRAPQLAAATANLEQAQATLASARRDLQYTQITAPFDAVVVSRDIQPGSFVQTGSPIATLYSTHTAQVAVALSAQQWQSLPGVDTLADSPWTATLTDMQHSATWQGSIHRVEQTLASDTRQRSVIITLAQPLSQASPLYFGTYVEATIAGKTWPQVWRIPATAISQQQEVWYVKPDNTLAKFSPTVLFQRGDAAYIQPLENLSEGQSSAAHSAPTGLRIVARPLNNYLPNMRVTPVEESVNGN